MIGQELTFPLPITPPWNAAVVAPTRLLLTSPDTRGEIEVTHWTAVHQFSADGNPIHATNPAPKDLTTWLVEHPGIDALPPDRHHPGRAPRAHAANHPAPGLPTPLRPGPPRDARLQPARGLHHARRNRRPPVILYGGSPMILIIQDTPTDQRLIASQPPPKPRSHPQRGPARPAHRDDGARLIHGNA